MSAQAFRINDFISRLSAVVGWGLRGSLLIAALLYGGGMPNVVRAMSSEAEAPVQEVTWSTCASAHGEARLKSRRRFSHRLEQALSPLCLPLPAAVSSAVVLSHAPLVGPRLSLGTCVPLRC